MSSEQQIALTLERQRCAFLAEGAVTESRRIDRIDRAIGLLVDFQEQIVEAVCADFGARSEDFTRLTEVLSPLMTLKQAKAQLAAWMQAEPRHTDRGQAWVQYQPLGVVGIVSPWNFPVNLAFGGLAGALAAGNRVMIKPSEFTPQTSALMARMIESAYSPEEVAVVTGDALTAQSFCAQPFDHLLFTGATSVGKHVMRAAAENLVPVTLELGGKSPTIISRSADFAAAVGKIVAGKLHNAGQICLAPDYVFVPRESLSDFIAMARATVAAMYPTLLANPDYTSLINARHFQRLHGYLAEARAAGVDLVELNPAGEDFSQQPQHKIAPTLLIDPADDLLVMQDEIFGPLLPVKPYDSIDQVISFINARPRPLGLYWFGSDEREQRLVLEHTTSGGVTINDVIRHVGVESLPFGGVGASGMGAYHGQDGFRTFSHGKAVLYAADAPDLLRPPYAEPARQWVRSLITR